MKTTVLAAVEVRYAVVARVATGDLYVHRDFVVTTPTVKFLVRFAHLSRSLPNQFGGLRRTMANALFARPRTSAQTLPGDPAPLQRQRSMVMLGPRLPSREVYEHQ